jgi:hypothetical protein
MKTYIHVKLNFHLFGTFYDHVYDSASDYCKMHKKFLIKEKILINILCHQIQLIFNLFFHLKNVIHFGRKKKETKSVKNTAVKIFYYL